MFRSLIPVALFASLVLPLRAVAGEVGNLDQAKTLSATQGKPILLEFFRDD